MFGVAAATVLSTLSDHYSVRENGKNDKQPNARSEGEKP